MTAVEEGVAAPVRFAAALDTCHEGVLPGRLVVSGQGWALCSAHRAPAGSPVADGTGAVVAVRGLPPSGPARLAAFGGRLLALQRRVLGELLDGAVERLATRTSDGTNLLNRQLVRGAIAEVALALSAADDLLALPGGDRGRAARAHRRLTGAGRQLVQLYGASGFAVDGPGPLVYLTELLGNTYLHAEPGDETEAWA